MGENSSKMAGGITKEDLRYLGMLEKTRKTEARRRYRLKECQGISGWEKRNERLTGEKDRSPLQKVSSLVGRTGAKEDIPHSHTNRFTEAGEIAR